MSFAHRFAVMSIVAFAAACGGGHEPAQSPEATPPTDAPLATPSSEAGAPITSLSRSGVKRTIADGLGVFLQNVAVEDFPAMRNGKFLGFKLRAVNPSWNVDLKPGDVILRVNGMPIEHPEDADAALRALEKAPSLNVDYEREGKARTLELPIVDDGPAPAAAQQAPQGKRAR